MSAYYCIECNCSLFPHEIEEGGLCNSCADTAREAWVQDEYDMMMANEALEQQDEECERLEWEANQRITTVMKRQVRIETDLSFHYLSQGGIYNITLPNRGPCPYMGEGSVHFENPNTHSGTYVPYYKFKEFLRQGKIVYLDNIDRLPLSCPL